MNDASAADGASTARRPGRLASCLTLAVTCLLLAAGLELAARSYSWWLGKGFWTRPHSFVSPFFVTYDWPPPLVDGERALFRRGQDVSRVKPADELRVVALGGSTTVNARNRRGLSYTSEVQRRLAPRFEQRLVVLNAGGDAFSSAHTLVNFSLRVLDVDPDLIIVYHAINDLSVREFGDQVAPDYANKYLDDAFLAYEHRSGVGGTVLRMSRAAQMLKWRLRLLRTTLEESSRSGVMPAAESARGAALFERNLRSLAAVAAAHRVDLVLVTQAHRDGDDGEDGLMRVYNERTRALGADLGVPVVDAAAALGGNHELFLDPVHLTSEGVVDLAASMAPVVEEELRQRLQARKTP